ncbi:LOW QUALITY PROTEIN: hypothetical protein ACHAW6_008002 [Cyclotella cf. meneghiniana]
MPIIRPSVLKNGLQVFAKSHNAMFIPKALKTVTYKGKTIQAYLFVGPSAPASERIYALLCNKHAAKNAFLSPLQMISFYSSCYGMDAHTRVADEFRDQVLIPSGVGGPCGLLPPALGATKCAIDKINKWQQLQFKIASAAQDSIYHKLREHLAPGFSATVFAACEKITMAFQDKDGNFSLTVLESYNALLQGAATFLEVESFQYNLANHFVNHLEGNVRDMFKEFCTDHLSFSDLSHDAQLHELQKYLLIATRCEKKLSQTKDFVKKTIGDTHSFMSKVMSAMGMEITEDTSDGPTFLSAAKKTLQSYKDGKRSGYRELSPSQDKCWGCKGPHCYHDKHTKEIICPNKDTRGVAKHAVHMHKEYLKALCAQHKGWVPKDKMKFSQLLPSQKEAGQQYFLHQAHTGSSLSSAPTHSHGQAYIVLPILHSNNAQHNCKPILPVQIDGQLPHITLVLGSINTALENCPLICCLFDTGACLSSGCAGFWLPILKVHPECIADLFTSDDGEYTPIILGGVVTGNDGNISCHTTQLNLSTPSLGKTFIKSLHCHYDVTSGVVEAKLLNVVPFPVTNMFPQHYYCANKVSHSSGRMAKNYSSIVSILDNIITSMLTLAALATLPYTGTDNSSLIRKHRHNVIGPDDSHTGYSTYLSDITVTLPAARIHVECRRTGRRKPNVYDRGHADWQQSWEWIEEGSYGKLLSRRTRLHPMCDTLDPTFNVPFDDARDCQYLCNNLRITHLSADCQNQIISLIKLKWGVFRPEGMRIPVLNYECNIDTGTTPPVWSKAVNSGPHESKIMQPMIDKLRSINQIRQKCHLFSPHFEFVGHDIAEENLTSYATGLNLASSVTLQAFLGFACSSPVTFHGLKLHDLRLLCQQDYNTVITPSMWTKPCQSQWDFMKQSILSDPCCAQYDHRKRFYLKTDFAQVGMGYVGCQPDNDDISLASMRCEIAGGHANFSQTLKTSGLHLG